MNPFDRFAPFIREYIYRARWEALRDFQAETAAALFDTPNHVLVMSGTASGKTEAAFLPILTAMHDDPPRSIGAMYVGPLKALINDQFERLSGLLSESGIPLQSWHGDVSQSRKERFLIEPRGVLQITPESLEAMLINRHGDIPRLFADLRYVVVDELHAFIASDRGRQLLCQLDRIARHIGKVPRRVGLSATLGDPDAAAEWLRGGTETPVTLVKDTPGARTIEIGVEHYGQQDYFADLADMTREGQKTLLFANARATAEEIAVAMHRIAEEQQLPDIYYVHHGAVAAEVRQEAEAAMRDPERAACTIATMTLELGIDLGRLDQVLQVGAPNTVSSFVQRLGRSGRRGTPSRMFFFTREKEPDKEPQQPDDPPAEPDQPEGDPQVESHTDETQLDENFEALESLAIPETPIKLEQRVAWDLLQTIAAIQLYVEERWIEPATTPQLPVSLLYQQTMSAILAHTELTPPQLAERILTLAPFAGVSQDDYRELLRHLLAADHLIRTDANTLIIGTAAEKVVNHYSFFATFKDDQSYTVRSDSGEIGTIEIEPVVGMRFALAGRTWRAAEVNTAKRVISVVPEKGDVSRLWMPRFGSLHARIAQRARQVLLEDTVYPYLQPHAAARLAEMRRECRVLATQSVFDDGLIMTWCGSREYHTILLMLRHNGVALGEMCPPYGIRVKGDPNTILPMLSIVPLSADQLVANLPRPALERGKYDAFVPDDLLRRAYAADLLDVSGALAILKEIAPNLATPPTEPDSSATNEGSPIE